MSHGVVVIYTQGKGYSCRHEKSSRAELAKRLAAIKNFRFGGDFDPTARYPGPTYFAASDTLVGIEAARQLGIEGEQDLFGGVVPYPFVSTKAITHPLVAPDAVAPEGWAHGFACRVAHAVLSGFSVFTPEDAHRAGMHLLAQGPIRLKPTRETGGQGQIVVADEAQLTSALEGMAAGAISADGLVLEENLSHVTTHSVGQVRVAEFVATYHGLQRLTADNRGAMVYGGSDLVVVRGGFEELLRLGLSDDVRLAVARAREYDAAAMEFYPAMFASRRNYDVAQGLNAAGRRRTGVLEQSWRIGGASGAEMAALEAFRADPDLSVVRASTIEIYGDSDPPPPHAAVYFRGIDEQVGPLTKYSVAETDVDP